MTSPRIFTTIIAEGLVAPCVATPSHTLPLTFIDLMPRAADLVEIFFVYSNNNNQQQGFFFHDPYEQGRNPAEIIRQALGKALVPYYPLAGRLVPSGSGGELQVACTGEGVWFVEARAGCTLQDVRGLEQTPVAVVEQLLPSPPNQTAAGMAFMMQVTEFNCGGFVVGVKLDHTIVDGIGVIQFLVAVADLARGLERPRVEPVWLRERFVSPPVLPRPPSVAPGLQQEAVVVDFSQQHIDHMIRRYHALTGRRCSAFDVSVAQLWRCRTRAIRRTLDPQASVNIMFTANARPLLGQLLPHDGRGYYGNCLYGVTVTARARDIADASVSDIVALMREAKKRAAGELSKVAGRGEDSPASAVTLGYESMNLLDWTNLGSHDVDYGWGAPTYLVNAPMPPDSGYPPICIVLRPPAPMQGRRMMTVCVRAAHVKAFQDEIETGSDDDTDDDASIVAKSKI